MFIIGGLTEISYDPSPQDYSSAIAKYENGVWEMAGSLKRGRFGHGAITIGSKTMIIGGENGSGSG